MNKAKIAAGLSAAALVLAAPLVMHFEGLSLTPYKDPVNVATVCFGETSVQMRRYTLTECKLMLADSMAKHGAAISVCMPEGLPDHVQASMLSFGYNVGAGAFCGSTMAQKLKSGDLVGACNELPKWSFVGGKDCRIEANKCGGIVKRRAAEYQLCKGV
jgi:lysozyme